MQITAYKFNKREIYSIANRYGLKGSYKELIKSVHKLVLDFAMETHGELTQATYLDCVDVLLMKIGAYA